MNKRITKTMINKVINEYRNRNIPMFYEYLIRYTDPEEKYNIVNDIKMTAKVLVERRVTFLIDLISHHDRKLAHTSTTLCNEFICQNAYQIRMKL
ncbi:hypothetical protein [Bacillus toyonensis]|uniref:Uncharacterized protein n=1 Tax=Bacillus toyonensis TaxID=155322 RepID=A0A2B7VR41_9BACI|nr:hypothetical protein [Bacillus toyonensis]PEJ91285.1 hypothetical protein CN688_24995 [Bacillus toyonensis]PEK76001.1 hypothetical protein CN594_29430 [Bacillus toyonensis]PEL17541.1 hypothetical protein CN624_29670 [Bacillus toyonensis]PFY44069.1 hypothetical protein COL54_12390 [Bacillus toyonensis]PFY49332.1 hypothetical protein COL55_12400 [Bacillus toyonensis]